MNVTGSLERVFHVMQIIENLKYLQKYLMYLKIRKTKILLLVTVSYFIYSVCFSREPYAVLEYRLTCKHLFDEKFSKTELKKKKC